MFDLDGLNAEINQLKAQTLAEYGKKVEFAIELMKEKERILKREKNMLLRLAGENRFKGFFKKKKYIQLQDRIQKKIKKLEKDIETLNELKYKYLEDYKKQREYLGLYDHEFIDKYFK
jgi:adenylate kinase family enzyme